MRVSFRSLNARETDHELLWSLVGLGALGLAFAWTKVGSPALLVCPLRAVTGLPCPTCGSTRAWAALLDGRLGDAARLNPLVFATTLALPPYAVYGLTVAAASLPRIRIQLGRSGRAALRILVALVGATLWLFLIIDGR